MPAVATYAPNDDGALRDPFGNVLPAFLCMERGESLADMRQSRRTRVDTQYATQVPTFTCLGKLDVLIIVINLALKAHCQC